MADRVMFVQLKTGHDIDKGPCWISLVRFTRTWQTVYWHGRELARGRALSDANFHDVETKEHYWVSGPHRDKADTRYTKVTPTIERTPAPPTRISSRVPHYLVAPESSRPSTEWTSPRVGTRWRGTDERVGRREHCCTHAR